MIRLAGLPFLRKLNVGDDDVAACEVLPAPAVTISAVSFSGNGREAVGEAVLVVPPQLKKPARTSRAKPRMKNLIISYFIALW